MKPVVVQAPTPQVGGSAVVVGTGASEGSSTVWCGGYDHSAGVVRLGSSGGHGGGYGAAGGGSTRGATGLTVIRKGGKIWWEADSQSIGGTLSEAEAAIVQSQLASRFAPESVARGKPPR